ncbi:hypothetical protein C5Y96_10870 [Blastopirellula marina]|uniref:Uncharacterized protein n=1 Tax=Blastopirellula marina TaxID=124 RepID=A0A2S8FME7_9BACT|nr:hypothetical protein C5Y96_10870 [Blastopirellula marina]RCS52435.1 hypothetical protein DTL36_10880 [Bremerella cremea]
MAVSLLVLVFGLPNIEQSRQEARSAQAFRLAQEIKTGTLPEDTVDPWGKLFEIRRPAEGEVTVVSRGPNGLTPSSGYDSDDVSTSMSDPPHQKIIRLKQIQVIVVLALVALPWLVLLVAAIRKR